MIPKETLTPDFKVSTKDFAVETDPSWSVGDTKEWQYKTPEERNELPAIYSAPTDIKSPSESNS